MWKLPVEKSTNQNGLELPCWALNWLTLLPQLFSGRHLTVPNF